MSFVESNLNSSLLNLNKNTAFPTDLQGKLASFPRGNPLPELLPLILSKKSNQILNASNTQQASLFPVVQLSEQPVKKIKVEPTNISEKPEVQTISTLNNFYAGALPRLSLNPQALGLIQNNQSGLLNHLIHNNQQQSQIPIGLVKTEHQNSPSHDQTSTLNQPNHQISPVVKDLASLAANEQANLNNDQTLIHPQSIQNLPHLGYKNLMELYQQAELLNKQRTLQGGPTLNGASTIGAVLRGLEANVQRKIQMELLSLQNLQRISLLQMPHLLLLQQNAAKEKYLQEFNNQSNGSNPHLPYTQDTLNQSLAAEKAGSLDEKRESVLTKRNRKKSLEEGKTANPVEKKSKSSLKLQQKELKKTLSPEFRDFTESQEDEAQTKRERRMNKLQMLRVMQEEEERERRNEDPFGTNGADFAEPERLSDEGIKEFLQTVEKIYPEGLTESNQERAVRLLEKFGWNVPKVVDNIKKNKSYYRKYLDGLTGN